MKNIDFIKTCISRGFADIYKKTMTTSGDYIEVRGRGLESIFRFNKLTSTYYNKCPIIFISHIDIEEIYIIYKGRNITWNIDKALNSGIGENQIPEIGAYHQEQLPPDLIYKIKFNFNDTLEITFSEECPVGYSYYKIYKNEE